MRLAKLDERLGANPTAARYDLEMARLRVAQQLAGNTRAVVSLGGNDLVSNLLLAQQARPPRPWHRRDPERGPTRRSAEAEGPWTDPAAGDPGSPA